MKEEMNEYTKIETPFKRDENGSKKLLEGVYRNELVEYIADCQWYGTEKIDGTNIGVVWDGHKVSYQGRTERAQIPTRLLSRLLELFGSNEAEELFEQKFGSMEVILFGEGFGAKIQSGGNYIPDGVDFILFDVYVPSQNLWLRRENIEDIAKSFGVRVVPVVFTGTINEAVEFVKTKPKSTIGNADMEGIVVKPMIDMTDRRGNRVMCKIKAVDF